MDTLKSMEKQITLMSDSLESLHTEVKDIKSELDTIKDLQISLENTQATLSDVEQNVTVIKTTLDSHEKQIDKLDHKLALNMRENKILKEQILHQDVYSRRENLIFVGLSEDEEESNQETVRKIRDLFTNKLGIADVANIKFQRCHRLGVSSDKNKPRDVIVRFVLFPDRENIWENRKRLKESNIIMKEDFPPEIERRRSTLYPIFKSAKSKKYKVKLVADKLIIRGRRYTIDTLDKLPVDLQPKTLAENKTDKAVMFYGSHSPFSNFYKVDFTINGTRYNSSEQYFQYQKVCSSRNTEIAAQILQEENPREQFQLAKRIVPTDQQWDLETAKQVMETGVRAKFMQNEHLSRELQNTGNKLLIQCNPHDKIWSCGLKLGDKDAADITKWRGENALGTILSLVRESLK